MGKERKCYPMNRDTSTGRTLHSAPLLLRVDLTPPKVKFVYDMSKAKYVNGRWVYGPGAIKIVAEDPDGSGVSRIRYTIKRK